MVALKRMYSLFLFLAMSMLFSGCLFSGETNSVAEYGGDGPFHGETPSFADPGQLDLNFFGNKQKEEMITNLQEIRGVWISYLDLIPILQGKTEKEFTSSVTSMFSKISTAGYNAVVVQVRPFGDAIYESDYYPFSHLVTGVQGVSPGYDPLAIMVAMAKKQSLQIHAWINPLRIRTAESLVLSNNNQAAIWLKNEKKKDNVWQVNGGLYFNPTKQDVQDLLVNGVRELVEKYNVDGVHIDDYFYPTSDKSIDEKEYMAYQKNGGTLSLSDWRLDTINKMVKAMYQAVKETDSKAVFGIAPQGNIDNNYTSQFADVKRWMTEKGYADYICPQIYFGLLNEKRPFADVLKEWDALPVHDEVKLYVGISAYKIGREDANAGNGKNEWIEFSDRMAKMVQAVRNAENFDGFIMYSYRFLFEPEAALIEKVQKETDQLAQVFNYGG